MEWIEKTKTPGLRVLWHVSKNSQLLRKEASKMKRTWQHVRRTKKSQKQEIQLLYCSRPPCIYLGSSVPVRLNLILQAKLITKDD